MGMFDNVVIEYPIEPKKLQDEHFQTKDFDCIGDTYRINQSGELWKDEYELEIVNFRFKRIHKDPIKLNFTGKFNFYYLDFESYLMYDFLATFENGILVDLKRMEY